jgi:hypothetical protein
VGESVILTQPESLRGYLSHYQPELAARIQPNTLAHDLTRAAALDRIWIVALGPGDPPALQSLQAGGWHAIRLDPSPTVQVYYAGRTAEGELWREAALIELPPQVLLYSDALVHVRRIDPALAAELAARERVVLQRTRPPLLNAQEIAVSRKLRRRE